MAEIWSLRTRATTTLFLFALSFLSLTARGAKAITSIDVSSDGNLLAVSSGQFNGYPGEEPLIRIFRVQDGKQLASWSFPIVRSYVRAVKFTLDSKHLVFAEDFWFDHELNEPGQSVNVVALANEKIIRGFTPTGFGGAIAVSPDGALLASSSNYEIMLWRMADGVLLHTLRGHQGGIEKLWFSPDGKTLASGGRQTAKLWRISDGRLMANLDGQADFVTAAEFSPDGALFTCAGPASEEKGENTLLTWRVADGKLLRSLAAFPSDTPAAISRDGSLAAATQYGVPTGKINFHKVSDGSVVRTITLPIRKVVIQGKITEIGDSARSLVFLPDGKSVIEGSILGETRQWRISDGVLIRSFN